MEIAQDQKEQNEGFGVLLKQGAEARVFESNFVGRQAIVKERFSKKYRHPALDSKLTLKRLNAEARCMVKARRLGVPTPVLYAVDPLLHTLTFEYVDGPAVKEVLLDFGANGIIEERMDDIATQIGDAVGRLHDGGLVHGDLTTSNMLIKKESNQLVLIDFGLSFTSTLPEDKAVDLYVLERALLSMHSSCGNVKLETEMIDTGHEKDGLYYQDLISKPVACSSSVSLFYHHCRLDGQNTLCIQEVFKTMVIHAEQASASETARSKAHDDRMSILQLIYCDWTNAE